MGSLPIPYELIEHIEESLSDSGTCKLTIGDISAVFGCGYNKTYLLKKELPAILPFLNDTHGGLEVDSAIFYAWLDGKRKEANARKEEAERRIREAEEARKKEELEREAKRKREAELEAERDKLPAGLWRDENGNVWTDDNQFVSGYE